MKTGRRRKKETAPEEPRQASPEKDLRAKVTRPPAKKPAAAGVPVPERSRLGKAGLLILVGLVVFVCGSLLISRACLGPRATSETYLPATADGSWTTAVRLVVPQVEVGEGWRSDCETDPGCTVVPGTCELRERRDQYAERKVDEYDDYAYNIYYEETEDRLYEADADTFVVTALNPKRDWWEEDLHYYSEEWLDRETCQYTNYTVWITDPEDADYEIEVVLSECEVWDHVVVNERVGEQDEYCQIESLGAMIVQDTLTQRGVGASVEWPGAIPPAGGSLERDFEGTVTFRANGTKHTVKVTDVDKYVRYLTIPFYLGVDEQGNVVDITDVAP